jgi:hypothetical protein
MKENLRMLKIVPVSSLFLSLSAIYLKFNCGMQMYIAELFNIDGVRQETRSALVGIETKISHLAIFLAIMSIALGVVSLHSRLCNKIVGIILLSISFVSLAFSILLIS